MKNLMVKKGITLKFTLEEVRDKITANQCGFRGQSRRFHKLDDNDERTGTIRVNQSPGNIFACFPDKVSALLTKSKTKLSKLS